MDVSGAIQAFIGDLDDFLRNFAAALQVLYDFSDYGLFRLMARKQFQAYGDLISVKQQAHADERQRPVFLARPFSSVFVFFIDFKIKIGAVEIQVIRIESVFLFEEFGKYLGISFVIFAEIFQTAQQPVIGER